jgi:metal-responsive CopG/Arc/MetJ family transcriptional regulator
MTNDTKTIKSKERKQMEQISLKIPVQLLGDLKEYAYRKGETPISYHIRQAIAEYLENHK